MKQYDVFLINLDPTIGHEIKKTRPCVVVSPDEMNDAIATVIVAPMTTKGRGYPTRVGITFREKKGWIALDQIQTIDKRRLITSFGRIGQKEIKKVKQVIREMLVD